MLARRYLLYAPAGETKGWIPFFVAAASLPRRREPGKSRADHRQSAHAPVALGPCRSPPKPRSPETIVRWPASAQSAESRRDLQGLVVSRKIDSDYGQRAIESVSTVSGCVAYY